jgi:hypothetical protein
MLVMRTSENPANPLCEFVGAKHTVGLYNLTLAMNPLGLYRVEPRALFRQKAAYDPHSFAAFFDLAVVRTEPAPDLFGDIPPPACVVPDEKQYLPTTHFELFATPLKESGRYSAHGPAINEPQPRLVELRHIEPVAGDGLRIGIVFLDRPLDKAQWLSLLGPAAQGGQGQPTPLALVQEAHRPLGIGLGHAHQSVAPPFFFRTGDRGR